VRTQILAIGYGVYWLVKRGRSALAHAQRKVLAFNVGALLV
jgi:hypothetical protein